MESAKPSLVITITRWAARIIGALMVALFLFFFVAEGLMPNEPGPGLTLGESLEMIATFVMVVGAIAAWRWEALGGWLCLGGGIFFNVVESIGRGRFPLVWFPMVFVLIGLAFLLCRRATDKRYSAESQ